MRRAGILLGCLLLLLCGCAMAQPQQPDKLQIVATLFPQYDFARQLAGEHAQVRLLLTPGVESHSYEPTPADILHINQADLFLYTGQFMEPWAQRLLDGLDGAPLVLDVSSGITLDEEDSSGHADHHDHDGHGNYDPHIWTSPANAIVMVQNILESLCAADPAHEKEYRANAETYLAQLQALDDAFIQTVEQGARREIYFGGRFALHYFAKRYGLVYTAAFDSCSSETEPSVGVMVQMVDQMREKQIPVVYYEELSEPKIARTLSEETGARMRLLHSCHNLSKAELARGETYLSLMQKNLEHLKEGLNDGADTL